MSVELNERRQQLLAGGGKDRAAKQHEAGKMTARERLGKLFDEGSFVETGVFAAGKAEASSVVTGYGTVNDRPVYAYAQPPRPARPSSRCATRPAPTCSRALRPWTPMPASCRRRPRSPASCRRSP